jgi:hypothetical protein
MKLVFFLSDNYLNKSEGGREGRMDKLTGKKPRLA